MIKRHCESKRTSRTRKGAAPVQGVVVGLGFVIILGFAGFMIYYLVHNLTHNPIDDSTGDRPQAGQLPTDPRIKGMMRAMSGRGPEEEAKPRDMEAEKKKAEELEKRLASMKPEEIVKEFMEEYKKKTNSNKDPDLNPLNMGPQFSDADLVYLKYIPGLKGVRLSSPNIADLGLGYLAKAPGLKTIASSRGTFTEAGLAHLAEMADLEQINLLGVKATDKTLEGIKNLKKLRVLGGFDTSAITDAGMKNLEDLTELVSIDFHLAKITDASAFYLKKMTKLKSIYFAHADLTDAAVREFAKLPALTELQLWDCKVHGEGLEALKGKAIARLNLAGNPITDEALVPLKELKNLEALDISETDITDKGLETIQEFKALKKLLMNRTKTTRDGRAALEKARPDLKYEEGEGTERGPQRG